MQKLILRVTFLDLIFVNANSSEQKHSRTVVLLRTTHSCFFIPELMNEWVFEQNWMNELLGDSMIKTCHHLLLGLV